MSTRSAQPLLSVEGVTKRYPNGTVALKGVDLEVLPATVHGFVGANGAGKSTLFKIVAGAETPTAGTIRVDGDAVRWSGPAAATAAGISTIYQHIPLVPQLSVIENVFLGQGRGRYRVGELRERYAALRERTGYVIEPGALVGDLAIGERQMVAIMHALAFDARLVLMDEATSSLSQSESTQLFEIVRRLREREGVAFVYCSHFLNEVLELCDVVSVLRDGRAVLTEETSSLTEERLVESLIGGELRALERAERERTSATTRPVLEVENLNSPGRLDDVSLTVRAGEIVGIAGLLGSGRSELLHAIFGADPRAVGTVKVNGRVVGRSTRDAVGKGIAMVPEERLRQGLVPHWSIADNVTLCSIQRLSRRGWLPDRERERARAAQAVEELGIVTASIDTPVSSLSGGNAQKVALAKWIYDDPAVILLDEPTHGVDVGAKADIVRVIRRLADAGAAVVIVSSEFQELLAEADRIVMLASGRLIGERDPQEISEEELLALVSGVTSYAGVAA